MQIQTFYNGLLISTQVMVDAAADGSLNKSLEESQELFELIASNNYQKPSERTQKRGVLEVDTTIALLAQMQALAIQSTAIQKKLGILHNSSPAHVLSCDFCQADHPNG